MCRAARRRRRRRTHRGDHGERLVVLAPRSPDRPAALGSVAEVVQAGHAGQWVLDFGQHTVSWPNHFAVATSGLQGVPFEWWGERGSSGLIVSAQARRGAEPLVWPVADDLVRDLAGSITSARGG